MALENRSKTGRRGATIRKGEVDGLHGLWQFEQDCRQPRGLNPAFDKFRTEVRLVDSDGTRAGQNPVSLRGSFMKIERILGAEIVHHADSSWLITSRFNVVTLTNGGQATTFSLPLSRLNRLLGSVRLVRRFLRLDKCSIALAQNRKTLIVAHMGHLYCYDIDLKTLRKTGTLQQCRTVLHMSIATPGPETFILGEYGRNKNRGPVPMHMSRDGGRSWTAVNVFHENSIRHIHGVYHDPFTDHLWVTTGDFEGECYLYEFQDNSYENPIIHGDGSQKWRTVNLFFSESNVVWIMDSQLETSHLVTFDRQTGAITVGQSFPGPVWYTKTLSNGCYLAQTTVERGPGVHTDRAHIFLSRDLSIWNEVAAYPHDGLPLGYFKNAVIAFSNGDQTSENFYISAEAIKGMDGRGYHCKLIENTQ